MATNTPSLASPTSSNRPTYSCVRCSDRKVRCDRQNPCSACLRHDVQCVFRAPPPPRRKKKRPQDGNLKDKLKRYEALFQNLGVDPNGLPNNAKMVQGRMLVGSEVDMMEGEALLPTPASTVTEPERAITTSQVLQGQGRSKVVDKWVCSLP
jgi:hypothetical protein